MCRLGGYEMHDLIVLDNTTVGVMVNVEQDALRVLTNQASCSAWLACCRFGGCVALVGVGGRAGGQEAE